MMTDNILYYFGNYYSDRESALNSEQDRSSVVTSPFTTMYVKSFYLSNFKETFNFYNTFQFRFKIIAMSKLTSTQPNYTLP